MKRWLVFNIGCIECGVSSNVVGLFTARAEADQVAESLAKDLHWREGGQNHFEVFDMRAPQAAEYAEVIAKATGGAT